MAAGMGSFTVHVTDKGKPLLNQSQLKHSSAKMDTVEPLPNVTTTAKVMEGLNID